MPWTWTASGVGRPAFSRARDPLTGQLLMDGTTRSWQAAASPLAEKLASALRTSKGTAVRDLDYGLDDSDLENVRTNAATLITNAIQSCLRRYVADGSLKEKPTVQVTLIDQATGVIAAVDIGFRDRDGNTSVITGTRT